MNSKRKGGSELNFKIIDCIDYIYISKMKDITRLLIIYFLMEKEQK